MGSLSDQVWILPHSQWDRRRGEIVCAMFFGICSWPMFEFAQALVTLTQVRDTPFTMISQHLKDHFPPQLLDCLPACILQVQSGSSRDSDSLCYSLCPSLQFSQPWKCSVGSPCFWPVGWKASAAAVYQKGSCHQHYPRRSPGTGGGRSIYSRSLTSTESSHHSKDWGTKTRTSHAMLLMWLCHFQVHWCNLATLRYKFNNWNEGRNQFNNWNDTQLLCHEMSKGVGTHIRSLSTTIFALKLTSTWSGHFKTKIPTFIHQINRHCD